MTDVLLIVPPNTFGAEPGMLADRLGVDYLLAVLRRAGMTAELVHCPAQQVGVRQTVEAAISHAPRVVGVSAAASRRDLETMGQIVAGIRDSLPNAHIAVGGYAATFGPHEMLNALPEVDSVVRGEGEVTFLQLVERVLQGRAWHSTPGISGRQNGQIVDNAPRPLIDDLDTLPFPARDFFSMENVSLDAPALVSSSRGCYGTCIFCSIHHFYRQSPGKVWRGRSPANVVDEIEHLKQRWGVRRIQFVDDHFLGPGRRGRNRAIEMAKELLSRKLRIEFFIEARADSVDEELFRLLKHAGLKAVFLGIESAVQRTLDLFRKNTSREVNLRALEVLDRLGLGCAPGLITFEPFVTPGDLRENIHFLRTSGLAEMRDIFFYFGSHLSVFAGTEMETILEDQGLLAPAVKKHARDCVNIRDYRFVDPRSEALFKVMTTWRGELLRRYALADRLPEGWARPLHTKQGADGSEAWLQAQNQAILTLFEQAINSVTDGSVPAAITLDGWDRRGLEALQNVDRRFFGMSFDEMYHRSAGAKRAAALQAATDGAPALSVGKGWAGR